MLNETKWISFFADCASYVMSEGKDFKLSGDKKIVNCTAEALSESRKLYELLCSSDSNVEQVKEAIIRKKRASNKFLKATGISWPF